MASVAPYHILDGISLDIWIAPVGEAIPVVNVVPGGNWIELGETDGEQSVKYAGALTKLRTNKYQGVRKVVRPTEELIFTFRLVTLTLENVARILDREADVVAAGGPPATKTLPLERGRFPNQYAVLAKSETLSPYGPYSAMYVFPIMVFDGEPELKYTREGRPEMETQALTIVDTTQSAANRQGWVVAQIS